MEYGIPLEFQWNFFENNRDSSGRIQAKNAIPIPFQIPLENGIPVEFHLGAIPCPPLRGIPLESNIYRVIYMLNILAGLGWWLATGLAEELSNLLNPERSYKRLARKIFPPIIFLCRIGSKWSKDCVYLPWQRRFNQQDEASNYKQYQGLLGL